VSCITCGIEIHKQINGGLDYDPAECIHCERNRYRWFYEDEKEKRQTLQAEVERLRGDVISYDTFMLLCHRNVLDLTSNMLRSLARYKEQANRQEVEGE